MRLLGHPVHPMLVAFPVVLLWLAPVCDGLALMRADPMLARAGGWCALVGLMSAVLALVTGFVDFVRLEPASPATKTAIVHGLLAFSATCSLGAALLLRGSKPTPSPFALVFELVAALLVGATGWFGGHLVFHHGIGVGRQRP
jgi:uncharacterized membrane protein